MELIVKRIAKRDGYTIGRLFIDGTRFCDTLEPTDRGLKNEMPVEEIKRIKLQGNTAIPYGTYPVTLAIKSPKYSTYKQYQFCNAYLPRLLNVKGFDGVLIHIGNKASNDKKKSDTLGCILVGENKEVGKVLNSTATFKKLYEILKKAKDPITITII